MPDRLDGDITSGSDIQCEGILLTVLSKIARVLIIIVMLLVLAVVGSILVLDPPPLRLQEPNEFVLSVTPPASDGARHPIEAGLACDHKLEGDLSGLLGRPQITFFDWLKRQSGKPSERDYHLSGRKPNDTWAVKVDRATNSFCYQTRSLVGAGLTDPHCGPRSLTRMPAVSWQSNSMFMTLSALWSSTRKNIRLRSQASA